TFPLTLNGAQALQCAPGPNPPTIVGSGMDPGGSTTTVVINGTSNGIFGCILDAQGGIDTIAVFSEGASPPPATVPPPSAHAIKNNTMKNAGRGITLAQGAGNVEISNNHFMDTGNIGIYNIITGANDAVLANNNNFDSGGATTDILCSGSQPNFTGVGNQKP